jgi:hypothetical protein
VKAKASASISTSTKQQPYLAVIMNMTKQTQYV